MKIGYARVSSAFEDLESQLNELTNFGCEKFFHERFSFIEKSHPQFEKLIDHLRKGDVVVVCSLFRIGRSTKDQLRTVISFQEKGVDLVCLQEGIDTRIENGDFFFKICRTFSELDDIASKERSMKGLEAARSRGRLGGRPKGLSKEAMTKANSAKILYESGDMTVQEIAKNIGISRATCYRYISQMNKSKS